MMVIIGVGCSSSLAMLEQMGWCNEGRCVMIEVL